MSVIPHLINGELVTENGRAADVFNPSTGQVIHKLPLASRETIQTRSTPPRRRSRHGATPRRPSVPR
jgi:acyl-CoA reductase-like NAD-dependent aldehyde dehydrogenase